MDIVIIPFLTVLSSIIGIYIWVVIASILMRWLINFHVINVSNHFVMMVIDFLYKVTEPVLNKIRRFLPSISGFDFSPLVLILFLWFIQSVIARLIIRLAFGHG